ncbi:FtsX-like permease family protein [Paenibacillus campinasensis]|uniref:FtsX-like permease family protein n=1 Tax=Paenibacillus campinasensis TaxID=66347 RepID=A0ABW9SYF9_9BACL|nr:ABC transporter permease [Paenibacillus campinasensis]MUG65707.1 FtsX-like permease family protein [Paenibacillus campinasensis]
MAAIWTLCWSHIRKNKIQNLFILLLILLSTLLVTTATIIIANTGNMFFDMHKKTNGSHQIIMQEKGLHDPQLVHQWWEAQEGVSVSKLLPYRTLSGITYDNQNIPNAYLHMMQTPERPFVVDDLVFAEGTESASPAKGTVWVPTSMANAYGMSVGDTVSFHIGSGQLPLSISAVVVDVPFGAPFTNTSRIWMNTDDYQEQIAPLPGQDAYMTGLRFDDYDRNAAYWSDFEAALGGPFLETKMEFEAISSFYLIIGQIVGFIMIFLGLVMMLIALITIGFTISDAVLANYKTIGILKSLGMTSSNTIGTYMMQYGLLAFIAVIPGLALSRMLSKIVIGMSVSSLSTSNTQMEIRGLDAAVLVGVFLFAVVILFVALYARKARHVQPVQAIRFGMSEAKSSKFAQRMNADGTSKIGFGNLPVMAVLGIRNLIKNRKGSVLMLILTTLASSVLVLGFIVLNSIFGIQQTAAKWGYDSANISALVINKMTFPREQFEQAVANDPRIKDIGWQGNTTAMIADESASGSAEGSSPLSIYLSVLDGSYEQMGFDTVSGYNPHYKNEIALGVNVARTLNKTIGDTVDVYIEGNKQTLLITGIYQAISNSSYSARVTIDAARAANPSFDLLDVAFINLHDVTEADGVVSDLNEAFQDSASIVTQQTLLDSVFTEAANIMIYPMSFIGLLFTIVTFIIIYSTCRINIRKESRNYGIYKSLGMTSRQIRTSITLGIAALSILGALLGIVIGIYGLPNLLQSILVGYGIVELPMIFHSGGVAAIASVSIIAAALGAWGASKVVQKSSPRILVVE